MIEESKHCSEMMEKHFNKEPVMTKKDTEDFNNSTKCYICDNSYVDGDVKVRNYCSITGKYRSFVYRDCNINVNLNHKIPTVFQNLKNCNFHLIIHELGKFSLKINVISNRLQKYMSFNMNDELIFIDRFQFLSSSLDSLVKNLSKGDLSI